MTSKVANSKFRIAIDLLCEFAKDFPPNDLMSDPNIGGTVTGEVKMSVDSESPLIILHALKANLHSNVKFSFVSLSRDTDGYWIPANALVALLQSMASIPEGSRVSHP